MLSRESDLYGGNHFGGCPKAIERFSSATLEFLRHGKRTLELLDSTLEAAPRFAAAHAMRGFGMALLAKPELRPAIALATEECKATLGEQGGGTAFEQTLLEALQALLAGQYFGAADRLDAGQDSAAPSVLIMKLSHQIRFMAGDLSGMRESAHRYTTLGPSAPGISFAQGCLAFALEESGDYTEAELLGLKATSKDPRDVWARHSVGHVYEMKGLALDGLKWSEETLAYAEECNNFGFHLAWHHALFLIELGRIAETIEYYDLAVRPSSTDDYRDISNACSLLVQLEQEGIDVGNRWSELAEIAQRRAQDQDLVFAMLHGLMSCLAVGNNKTVQEIITSLRLLASRTDTDQAFVAREIGLPLAEYLAGRNSALEPLQMSASLPRLGGSNAQRDVFVRSLAVTAAKRGDARSAMDILEVRRKLTTDSRGLRVALARW